MVSPNDTLTKVAAIPSANQNRYVIFDLDNCLSDDRERMALIDWDAPNPTLKYNEYHQQCYKDKPGNLDVYKHWIIDKGFTPIFMTARPDTVRGITLDWLQRNVLRLGEDFLLLMRSESNHDKSAEVKRKQLKLLMDYNIMYEDIVIAFDDRSEIIEMYANHGISGKVLKIHDVCAYTRPVSAGANIDAAKPETIRATAEEIRALEEFDRGSTARMEQALSQLRAECAPSRRAPDILAAAAKTFAERNKLYGDNYLRFGAAFLALFPGGELPPIRTAKDMDRLQLMMQALNKLTRYAECLGKGGHKDSAHDLCVYAAMLEEMTDERE